MARERQNKEMRRQTTKPRTREQRALPVLAAGFVLCAFGVLVSPALAGEESVHRDIRIKVSSEDCNRCDVQADFVESLREFGIAVEAVALSRGVGVFYTTKKSRSVEALQEIVEEAVYEIQEINEDPHEHHFCEFCAADFPIYSKLEHEILETNRGVFLLITSSDPEAIVAVQKMFRVYHHDRTEQQLRYQFRFQEEQQRELDEKLREMEKELEREQANRDD